MILAQLVEWPLPTPEVCSSNATIGKLQITYIGTVNCIENAKIKKKRPRAAHFKNYGETLLLN